jgi:hypothetical protein
MLVCVYHLQVLLCFQMNHYLMSTTCLLFTLLVLSCQFTEYNYWSFCITFKWSRLTPLSCVQVHADLNRELTHYGLVSAVGCFIWIASMLTVNFLAGTRPDEEVFVVISNGVRISYICILLWVFLLSVIKHIAMHSYICIFGSRGKHYGLSVFCFWF